MFSTRPSVLGHHQYYRMTEQDMYLCLNCHILQSSLLMSTYLHCNLISYSVLQTTVTDTWLISYPSLPAIGELIL